MVRGEVLCQAELVYDLPLTSWVTLSKALNLFELQFRSLPRGANTYIPVLL